MSIDLLKTLITEHIKNVLSEGLKIGDQELNDQTFYQLRGLFFKLQDRKKSDVDAVLKIASIVKDLDKAKSNSDFDITKSKNYQRILKLLKIIIDSQKNGNDQEKQELREYEDLGRKTRLDTTGL